MRSVLCWNGHQLLSPSSPPSFLSSFPSLFAFCLFPFGFSQEHLGLKPFSFWEKPKEEDKRQKEDGEDEEKEKKEDEDEEDEEDDEDDEEEQEAGEQFGMKLIKENNNEHLIKDRIYQPFSIL